MTVINKKHAGQVRIIGGSHRSRIISFKDAQGLRPTADSVREKVFNWLGQRLDGQNVLDAFAGSGVMGFEAASRGAMHVVMLENNPKTFVQLQTNRSLLQLEARVTLHKINCLTYLQQPAMMFDVVFLDPPYAWNQWIELWQYLPVILKPQAWIYVETDQYHQPTTLEKFELCKKGHAGASHFSLWRYNPHA